MKKSFLFLTMLSFLVIFNACKKDAEIDLIDAPNSPTNTENRKRTCGTEELMERLLQDPDYERAHRAKFKKLEKITGERTQCSSPTILPIAVHFQGVSNPDIACLRNLAQSQIDILNADYGGTNSDISTWVNTAASSFPGVSNGEACIKFCIATKNHPTGYGVSNGDLAVTVNTTTGDSNNDWTGYINIFVQANTGLLGYSPLGGSGNGDGVVVDASAFGMGAGCGSISPNAPYDLGRTLTHELGHYLLLDHIWGGGCGSDDNVADTPDSQDSHYGCPNIGVSTCGSTDMHMNYMDYTNDACMYMFSAGQATRMENYVASSLQNIVNNAANVCEENNGGGGGNDSTCSDGIQNGNETGVDCGGPDCQPCAVEPTCDDGIQNGQETGVDCGGPECQPCTTEPTCDDGIQNGQETGVDCGGPECQPCNTGGDDCDAPSNLTVTRIDDNAVAVTFDASPDAIEYQVRYRDLDDNNYEEVIIMNTYTVIDGLTPTATYEVVVRTVCEEGLSEAIAATFDTQEDEHPGGDCECEGALVGLNLTLDDYAEETAWELFDENGEVVANSDPYTAAGATIEEEFCLEDGCYTFSITDTYGDGICCDYGDGSYDLTDGDGNPFASSDGNFGEWEAIDFCVDNGVIDGFNFRKDEKDTAALQARGPKNNN